MTYHGLIEINLMLGGYNFAPLTFITYYILLQFQAYHALFKKCNSEAVRVSKTSH